MPSSTPTTKSKAKKPADKKPKQYGLKKSSGLRDFETSGGELVQMRELRVEDLIAAGILDDVDSLSGTVKSVTIPTAEGKPEVDTAKLMQDPAAVKGMFNMMDTLVLLVVVQPQIHPIPYLLASNGEPLLTDGKPIEDARDPDKLYIDEIDLNAKAEIMEEAMKGVNAFNAFRS